MLDKWSNQNTESVYWTVIIQTGLCERGWGKFVGRTNHHDSPRPMSRYCFFFSLHFWGVDTAIEWVGGHSDYTKQLIGKGTKDQSNVKERKIIKVKMEGLITCSFEVKMGNIGEWGSEHLDPFSLFSLYVSLLLLLEYN